jgi:flagellar motor switch protein FliM
VAALELVVALRRSCAATIPAPILLKPLAEGLARQPVTVSAMLGRASVTLSEFSQLSSGDVLLLDGDPSDTLELAIERRARSGSCTIEERAGSYQLKIVEPVVSVG